MPENAVPDGTDAKRAVRKGEARREAAVEPDPEGVPLGDFVLEDGFAQLRFDGLWLIERADLGLARHDAEAERHFGISLEDFRVVGMAAVFGLRFHADLVIAIGGHALRECQQRSIGTLVPDGLGRLVESHKTKIVNFAVGAELALLLEIIGKAPRALGGRCGRGERFFDDLVGRLDVLGEQVAGGLQSVTDVVHVLDRLVAREFRRRIKHRHIEREEIADGVQIFAPIEATEDGLTAGAGETHLGVGGELGEVGDDGGDLGGHRMFFCFLGGHFTEVELVDDVLDLD